MGCVSFVNGLVSVERLLEGTHEEANDLIFFRCKRRSKDRKLWKCCYCISWHRYICTSLHHFCKLKYFDLEELWFVSGQGNSRTFFPITYLTNNLDSDLVEVLPVIHALTGCDTASKVGTKSRAVREGVGCYHLLYAFGRDALIDEMIADAEKFLLKCITKHDADTFHELRFIVYHEKYFELDSERFPPTSDNIRQHILRAYRKLFSRKYWPGSTLIWLQINWGQKPCPNHIN